MFDPKIKILVVDDMMTIRKIVKKNLSTWEYKNVIEAADGVEAWQVLEREKDIQFVISDWNMPNMTGIDLLKKVRGSEFKDIAFILLTAEADVEQVKLAISCGVDNYLTKPFTPENLKIKMDQAASAYSKRKNIAA